jgi:sporulation protein YlmC with PRC-barrel domain
MKKIAYPAVALFVFSILFFGIGNSYSQEFPQGTITMYDQSDIKGWDTLEASSMMGAQLLTRTGDRLGQISDLVVDSETGHILEVILSDVRGKGGEQVAVPFAALSHTGSNIFIFNKPGGYPEQFTSTGGPFFEKPFSEWAEIRFLYSDLPLPMEAYHVSALMGAPVRTPKGDEVGRVNDLVIDFAKDQLVYSVLSDVGEKEGRMVAVPFGELSKGSGDMFTLHITKEELMDSPAFAWTDMANRKYAADIYRYYGVQPYWEE